MSKKSNYASVAIVLSLIALAGVFAFLKFANDESPIIVRQLESVPNATAARENFRGTYSVTFKDGMKLWILTTDKPLPGRDEFDCGGTKIKFFRSAGTTTPGQIGCYPEVPYLKQSLLINYNPTSQTRSFTEQEVLEHFCIVNTALQNRKL